MSVRKVLFGIMTGLALVGAPDQATAQESHRDAARTVQAGEDTARAVIDGKRLGVLRDEVSRLDVEESRAAFNEVLSRLETYESGQAGVDRGSLTVEQAESEVLNILGIVTGNWDIIERHASNVEREKGVEAAKEVFKKLNKELSDAMLQAKANMNTSLDAEKLRELEEEVFYDYQGVEKQILNAFRGLN